MFRALKSEQKGSNFFTGFWIGSTGLFANWLWEKSDISGVSSYERN